MKSQNKQILEHLQAGNAISSFTAIKKYGCTRLAARIRDLKDAGHEIYGKMVESHDKRYKVYYQKNSRHFEAWGVNY